MTALTEWQNFYVIVGSSAGALIGLQFVVIICSGRAPFLRAAATLLLLLIGIHNAWDAVTYHVFSKR